MIESWVGSCGKHLALRCNGHSLIAAKVHEYGSKCVSRGIITSNKGVGALGMSRDEESIYSAGSSLFAM